jgi:hypothetical protein
MPSPESLTPKAMPLLIESSTGVSEYLIGVVNVEEKPAFSPLAARVASGGGSLLDRDTLREAVALQVWAHTHSEVFLEGRVA